MRHSRDKIFETFARDLAPLGCGDIDPELKLRHLVLTDDLDGLDELMKNPGWEDGALNVNVADSEIVSRCASIRRSRRAEASIAEAERRR